MLYTYCKTYLFELREQRRVKKLFYINRPFREKDRALLRAYRFNNPYRICKRFLIKRGVDDPDQYGETPLTTLGQVVRHFGLGARDTVIEMGAGRGRVALFLAEYVGCRVLAFEIVPHFVEKMVWSEKVTVWRKDMFEAPFAQATVIFLYGTMLADRDISVLAERIPAGIKVITVSYPLCDYCHTYRIQKTITGAFPWGKTEVYLNERIVQ